MVDICDELIGKGYSIDRIILGTKNLCYSIISPNQEKLFLKCHRDLDLALTEMRFLQIVSILIHNDVPSEESRLRVPEVLDIIECSDCTGLICQFIEGENVKDLILSSSNQAYQTCSRLIFGVAQIHQWVSSYADDLFPNKTSRVFGEQNDCRSRTGILLHEESRGFLQPEEITSVQMLLSSYFQMLYDVGKGFPCDFYKDANPTNWILQTDNGHSLIAVDFETKRILPCIVDILNITEFGSHYLTKPQRHDLLRLYIDYRASLDQDWGKCAQRFDVKMLYNLFGIYRHHEQLLHRLRDLKRFGFQGSSWHRSAFCYHKSMMVENARAIYEFIPTHQARQVLSEMDTISVIYESALARFVGTE